MTEAKTNCIITIGRQYGSGGREIGTKLAEKLGVPYYDKELIALVAEKSDICMETLQQLDEKGPTRVIHTPVYHGMTLATGLHSIYNMPISDRVFVAQLNVIKDLAAKGPCVIVGRCADYVLRQNPNCLNVFVHASMEFRAARKKELEEQIKERTIQDYIRKIDKSRAKYYNYYTSKKWGDTASYHMTMDSGVLGIDTAAQLLYDCVQLRQG